MGNANDIHAACSSPNANDIHGACSSPNVHACSSPNLHACSSPNLHAGPSPDVHPAIDFGFFHGRHAANTHDVHATDDFGCAFDVGSFNGCISISHDYADDDHANNNYANYNHADHDRAFQDNYCGEGVDVHEEENKEEERVLLITLGRFLLTVAGTREACQPSLPSC